MSRRRSSVTLSLFPFLAVLICTMGVLVALLLLVVKQADQTAKQDQVDRQSDLQQQIESIKDQMAIDELRSSVMADDRQRLISDVKQKRALRSHLDSEIAKLQQRGQKLESELAAFQQSQLDSDVPRLQQTLDHQLRRLTEAKTQLKDLEESSEEEPAIETAPVYSIVPIAAKSGTDRRPIYIECSEAGVVLYPGGHRLSPDDFVVPLHPGNPLDAALVAYREHWGRKSRDSDGAYPLMVVRPSGAQWYAVIRRAMQSWEDEFGYELVPEDWKVDFGKSDEELDQRVGDAIELALQRQETLLKLGRVQRLTDQQQTIADGRINSVNGGGMNPQQTALVPSARGGFKTVPASHSEAFGSFGSSSRSPGGDDPLASLSADYHRQQAEQFRSLSGSGVGGYGNTGSSSNQQTNGAGTGTGQSMPGNPFANGGLGTHASATGDSFGGTSASANGMVGANAGSSGFGPIQGSGGSGMNAFGAGQMVPSPNGQAVDMPNARGQSSNPQNAGRSGTGSQQTATQEIAAERNNSASGNVQVGDASAGRELSKDALARQRGEDWALPARRRNVSAYHRPISVDLDADRLVLKPGLWNRESVTIQLRGSLSESVDPLIDAIWKRVDSWGSLGFDGYWKPVLRIKVTKENVQLVDELEGILDQSGLAIERTKE